MRHAFKTAAVVLARRVQALDGELTVLDAQIEPLVKATAPALLNIYGVGIDTAATLLTAAGDNAGRIRCEAAWAKLCGAAPIPIMTGKRDNRYRLNPGGNRHANNALWRIVLYGPVRVSRRTGDLLPSDRDRLDARGDRAVPLSSLGHSILVPAWLGESWALLASQSAIQTSEQSPYVAFIVALHVATAIALLIYYRDDWIRIVRDYIELVRTRRIETSAQRLGVLLIVATIPVGITGLALEHTFRTVFAKPLPAAIFLTVLTPFAYYCLAAGAISIVRFA